MKKAHILSQASSQNFNGYTGSKPQYSKLVSTTVVFCKRTSGAIQ